MVSNQVDKDSLERNMFTQFEQKTGYVHQPKNYSNKWENGIFEYDIISNYPYEISLHNLKMLQEYMDSVCTESRVYLSSKGLFK